MKTKSKALLMTLCAVLLVAASVLGTMAYLTSQDSVTNTFSIGKINITLDEQDVDNSTPGAERDKANAYHLLPGQTYIKDPTVHVTANSEDSWIFVKVENGIAAFEAATVTNGYKNIADQITAKGWQPLTGVANVYYKEYDGSEKDFVVFENFKIADDANTKVDWSNINADSTKVIVTAYAIQKDANLNTAAAAWAASGFGA